MANSEVFFDRLQTVTEGFLSRRARKRRLQREKQQKRNVIVDWLDAFLWAAGWVLLINQYLFQAFEIPSGSMIDTLLIKDRIFVNKVIYGPEILPGMGKLPSLVKPHREDVIIFENPAYLSKGVLFDIAQRVIFMLTISLVDIDKDEFGRPEPHFLIKRAAGMPGDTFKIVEGDMQIKFPGEDKWTPELEHIRSLGYKHRLTRLIAREEYPALRAAGKAAAYGDLWLDPPQALLEAASPALSDAASDPRRIRSELLSKYMGDFSYSISYMEFLKTAFPQDERYRTYLARQDCGRYLGEGQILPLGDNRDNSQDGRFFGPIQEKKVLGRGAFIHWPVKRIGIIK